MDRRELLRKLPSFNGRYELIKRDQSVHDIIKEILEGHKDYARDYDKIAFNFFYDDPLKIVKGLWSFCKGNIQYREEPEKRQTVMNPSGILALSRGDCKHYSLFIGGVLDAINRAGIKIDWWYRFAGYEGAVVPAHVFVVAKIHGREYWVDPVLKSFDLKLQPTIVVDKKINDMSLYRVSGVGTGGNSSIGLTSITVTPFKGDNLNFDGTGKWANVFSPYLGLSMYRDYGGDRNINEATVAQLLNAEIAKGPNPGHTVAPDFVKWVYDFSIRSWNFYYPGGVKPGFSADTLLPANYPRLVIIDNRLTFDKDIKIDDYRNAEIHLLCAWGQALINKFDPSPYPLKPLHLKEFSQLLYGNVDTRNLFTERRGESILQEIGKALEDTVNFIKDKVLLVAGFIPRNAFLGLIGINAFNWAGNMWEKIQGGQWDAMSKKWKALGGIPDKLYNTIKTGKDKNAILGAEPATTSTATLLAAAAPIIAALLAFLDKDGKAKEILSATKRFLQVRYPKVDFSGFDFLDQPGGSPILWEGDPKYDENLGFQNPGTLPSGNDPIAFLKNNPIVAAGLGAGGTYLLTKRQPQQKRFLFSLLVGAGIFMLLKQTGNTSQRAALLAWANALPEAEGKASTIDIFKRLTDSEVTTVYTWVFDYLNKNIAVPQGTDLYNSIMAIDAKYQLIGT